jgi:hypothetical protein
MSNLYKETILAEIRCYINERRCQKNSLFFLKTIGLEVMPHEGPKRSFCTFKIIQEGKQDKLIRIRANPALYHLRGNGSATGLQVETGHRWLPLGDWMNHHYSMMDSVLENAEEVSELIANPGLRDITNIQKDLQVVPHR